eukprot:TRINITY_DN6961_c0_g1_i5.p1 TRINITY_DN6961_c0_g1~~TRINITY_DN6961_c0_g1_i5.p1  ORF type:complete len:390 (+),score=50.95 TRINITY_DN6961_c0_g1_i5:452-1621(+)
MFMTALSGWSRLLFFRIITSTAIPILARFLDTVPTWLVMIWWLPDYYKTHIAQDGRPCLEGIAVGELHVYSDRHPRETVQALTPWLSDTSSTAQVTAPVASASGDWFQGPGPRHVLYIHGGGFLAANAVLLMPSITPFVRAGYTVWCINYPLSPESQHPASIVSVLRALDWLRAQRNVDKVSIVGDSAGGHLATAAAAFVECPGLLKRLEETWDPSHARAYHPDEIAKWRFPRLTGVVSLYGVLDNQSWACKSKRLSQLSWLENKLSQFGLELCTWSYCKASSPTVLDGRKFFCDFIPELDKYPACLLVCGTLDILVHSSRRAAHMLKGKGFQCQIAEYEARHAFVGLPPVLYFGGDSWKYLSAAATVKIVNFLDECHATSNTASSPPK